MNEIRAKRFASSTVLFLVAGLVSAAAMASISVPAGAATPDPGTYQALAPARILDTRIGNGAPAAPVAPAATLNLTVLGAGGIPASGVSAVVFNLTDVNPSNAGFISAFPAGQPTPLASSLNFATGVTRAHLVVVAPGTSGQVALFNGSVGPVDLLADVVGYYTAGSPTAGGEFAPVNPARILDTRTGNGAPLAPVIRSTPLTVQVTGRGGVPSDGVSSVMVNLTAARPSTYGYLAAGTRVYSQSSSVNFRTAHSVSNLVVVPVSYIGTIAITAYLSGHVDVVADVVGYFLDGPPAAAGRLGALPPTRLLDTRLTHDPIPAQGSIDLAVGGYRGVPSAATAAVLNFTVAGATTSGYLAAYPTGMARPTSSTVNFDNNTVANLVIAPLGPDGKVRIYNSSSLPAEVVVDVSGYVGAIPGPLTWSKRAPLASTGPNQVSCGSATFCMAIDGDGGDSYRYDGHSWSTLDFPESSPTQADCLASGFCMAVGYNVAFTFDGTRWSLTPFPSSGWTLDSVSCVSATFCVVAGSNNVKVGAWLWDGATFTEIDPDLPQSNQAGVSCASTTFCLLIDLDGGTARFDGTRWTVLASRPDPGSSTTLSCVTNTFCVAFAGNAPVVNDGTRWGLPTTLAWVTDNIMTLSCTSTTFCLAGTDGGYELTYDGSSWSHEFMLDPSKPSLQFVSCVAASFCVTVGQSGFQTGT